MVESHVFLYAELDAEKDTYDEYDSPMQLNENMVTLSLLPESRWKNLLNLDIIKVLMALLCRMIILQLRSSSFHCHFWSFR